VKKYVSNIIFICILFVSTTLSPINIRKLNLQTLNIYNTTNTKQKIKLFFISDHSEFTEFLLLLPQEKKTVFNDHCIIEKVVTTNSSAYSVAKISNDNENICVQIQTEKKDSSSGLLPFNETIKTDPGLEKILNKTSPADCRRLPDRVTPAIFIEFIRTLYEKNRLHLLQPNPSPRIPLIMHRIWFGNPMPEEYKQWKKEWEKEHPEWRVICWTKELLAKEFPQGLYNQKTFDEAKAVTNYAKMADVLRYEILFKHGGLYLDCDMINFENFTQLHYTFDFYAGLEEIHDEVELGNGLIGSRAGHPVLQTCMEGIKHFETTKPDMKHWDTFNPLTQEVNSTLVTTGPVLFTKAVWTAVGLNESRDIVLPSSYIYCSSKVRPISLCNHIYEDRWVEKILRRI
jgi:hypothetical protein